MSTLPTYIMGSFSYERSFFNNLDYIFPGVCVIEASVCITHYGLVYVYVCMTLYILNVNCSCHQQAHSMHIVRTVEPLYSGHLCGMKIWPL